MNIFKGVCSNPMFMGIVILTFVIQLLMVNFGGPAVRCVPLNQWQNLYCGVIGFCALLWGLLIKLILPSGWFAWMTFDDKPMSDKEEQASLVANFRMSARQASMKKGKLWAEG